jgi:glycine/D-amino acid oxidase-like deaminating enzyme
MAAQSLAVAAQRLGAEVHTGVRVTGFRVRGGKVEGVESDRGFLPAGAVVVATGPWTPSLLGQLGVKVPIIIARIKIGLYRRPPDFEQHMVWGDFVGQIYLRPETGGLTLVGSISPEEAEDRVADPDHFNEKVEMDILADFGERAAKRYPALERSHLASNYASLYDITPDWHHLLDVLPGYENLYICAGGSGHGFKLSPAVGEMMAQLVLHGKNPEDDIHLFSFERFAAEKPVRGQYEYSILG